MRDAINKRIDMTNKTRNRIRKATIIVNVITICVFLVAIGVNVSTLMKVRVRCPAIVCGEVK